MPTLLIADDQTTVREALAALLGMESDFEVVAQCARGDEVLPAVRSRPPDVALLDVDMPGPDGLEVAVLLAAEFPLVKVVIVTTCGRPGWVKRALDAGISGCMVKSAPLDRLADGIRRVMTGLEVIDPELVVKSRVHGQSPLTERETEVLRAAADGGSAHRPRQWVAVGLRPPEPAKARRLRRAFAGSGSRRQTHSPLRPAQGLLP